MILDIVYQIGCFSNTLTQWCIRMTCKEAFNFQYPRYDNSIVDYVLTNGSYQQMDYFNIVFGFMSNDLNIAMDNCNKDATQWFIDNGYILNDYHQISANGWLDMLIAPVNVLNQYYIGLHSIRGGHLDILMLYLKDNSADNQMISLAISLGHFDIILYLAIQHQVPIDDKSIYNMSSKLPAYQQIIKWLLTTGVKCNLFHPSVDMLEKVYYNFIADGNISMVEWLVSNGHPLPLEVKSVQHPPMLKWVINNGCRIATNSINGGDYSLSLWAYNNGYQSENITINLLINGHNINFTTGCIKRLIKLNRLDILHKLTIEWNYDYLVSAINDSNIEVVLYILQHSFKIQSNVLKYVWNYKLYNCIDIIYKRIDNIEIVPNMNIEVISYLESIGKYEITHQDYESIISNPSPTTKHLILKYKHLMPSNPYIVVIEGRWNNSSILDFRSYGYYPTDEDIIIATGYQWHDYARWMYRKIN